MAPSTIKELLASLDLDFLNEHFEQNCIDLQMLSILNESEIKELVPQIGARRKLNDYLKEYHKVHTGPNVFSGDVYASSVDLKPSSSLSTASTVILEKEEIVSMSNDGEDCLMGLDHANFRDGSNIHGAGNSQSSTPHDHDSQSIVLGESAASMHKLCASESVVVEIADVSPPAKKLKGMRRFFPNEVTLHDLIQQSSKLSMIRDIHISKGCLQESERRKLVAIVIDRLLDRHTSVTKETLHELAQNICEEFPSECVSTYFYFNAAVSKNARGKLCDRYHNELKIRRKFRNSLSSESDTANSSASSSSASISAASSPISDEVQTKIKWLKHSQEPWETVILYWMETFQARQDQTSKCTPLHQFIQDWPILQHDNGHQLVK